MKIVIVALIAFMLGFGAYWGYNQYQTVLKENQELKKLEKSIPSSTDEEAIPTATVTPTKAIETKGTIEGELGYPSEGIPALEVYAFNSIDQSKYFLIKTGQNQGTFTIKDVDPGTYYVVAYPVGSNSSLAGGYSKMVPCGLSVECTDHSLIPVNVTAGQTTSGVEVRDWYAPEGTFPKKP
ncbi:MAG: hypothetical protein US40_C0002G0043 [Candidatus Roizmanbacteria bacterium GW2011_GWC2_37_13]|uniref:Carboxypeptidase regulatory-like domain-containing protein n=1 Tax=Candidatus Roizmanbacteria bacterium GW2011_GWC2_37_13 TaxID=1618486 RepID=A0A0G0IQP2_9BACT|nr:MAG: hypothetical protein US38_C0006G0043 [Candidatus Roizmanbacteria bacterium GW2011_GWC1_37_12]KKQ26509.1 MAG: hypothetical protein US40_C0002G0043 [Candidatus Roizmanbacteria bacterium GW2011_GWC2_37_13]